MADVSARIEHFKKMAADDPNNELGHFALGRAYFDAGMYDEAITALEKAISLNPGLSRAYQQVGAALVRCGKTDAAIARLTQGVAIAHERGDMMPKGEMIALLKELGAPVPEVARKEPERPVGSGEVFCSRCGKVGPKLARPPFRNAQGEEIQQKVCEPCWREWIAMGTKVINELRLPLNEPEAQRIFDQHMYEFLNLR